MALSTTYYVGGRSWASRRALATMSARTRRSSGLSALTPLCTGRRHATRPSVGRFLVEPLEETGSGRARVIRNFTEEWFDSLYPRYAGGRWPTFTSSQRAGIDQIALGRPLDHVRTMRAAPWR